MVALATLCTSNASIILLSFYVPIQHDSATSLPGSVNLATYIYRPGSLMNMEFLRNEGRRVQHIKTDIIVRKKGHEGR